MSSLDDSDDKVSAPGCDDEEVFKHSRVGRNHCHDYIFVSQQRPCTSNFASICLLIPSQYPINNSSTEGVYQHTSIVTMVGTLLERPKNSKKSSCFNQNTYNIT